MKQFVTCDANEAAADIAHRLSEVIAIYPITPASPMGEFADAWSQAHRPNLWGTVPRVVEMQSEAGAAGTVHGSLLTGALTTTFTASQGLLLMIPNMYKIAGELLPCVIHVAARTIATHALSIFGDHSDVMGARSTGWAMLAASSVQEAHDFAALAHQTTLEARVPFLHFFDGFRTSHEIAKIRRMEAESLKEMFDADLLAANRRRALDPDHPTLRGSTQNPDIFFQAREASNPFHDGVAGMVERNFRAFEKRFGRSYHLFDYHGSPQAERVIVLMGSGAGAAREAVDALVARGEKVGMVVVRLYRPFDIASFIAALPSTTRSIAVLDRTKEPGAIGEPLYLDVVSALAEGWPTSARPPRVIGGRYGLSSKEFTPSMTAAVFAELKQTEPKRHFTIGILDDVTHRSLAWDPEAIDEPSDVTRCVFYGLGSDGTVGANKNTVKIIGENTPLHAQGYFVYDSKKSGAMTISHLRFGPQPIESTYLVQKAQFVACHQFQFLDRLDVLSIADRRATFLLNSPYSADEVWDQLPVEVQRQIIDKELRFYVVDGNRVAREAELGGRINTVLQTCFFALANLLPKEESIAAIKHAIEKSYGKRGETVLRRNFAAVDAALAALQEVQVPKKPSGDRHWTLGIQGEVPDFVRRVTSVLLEGKGDLLPVSAFPPDGTFPVGTAKFEKRSIAAEIPIWEPDLCIECGLCSMICPHAAIRMKPYPADALASAPADFASKPTSLPVPAGARMTIQVAPDDCTGCSLCVSICPARSKEVAKRKAINMEPKQPHLDRERSNFDFFLTLPTVDRTLAKLETVKGSQLLEPLFEFSGACAGCGETIYLRLLSQMFGNRAVVANATGCSSIYGGNLPTTPWSADRDGRGPAWANSLFEDNAEFGLGMRLALDQREKRAGLLLQELASQLGDAWVNVLSTPHGHTEVDLRQRRDDISRLRSALAKIKDPRARELEQIADVFLRRSVWIIGGDGWAYDIGFGGLDHVLSTGVDVNILVLDTEVYSNTGGQMSKSTPRAAVAKFASGGKNVGKKDIAMIAMAYGNVYVAHLAVGAHPAQTHRALVEAESYRGPSLLIAYSHCIAHGIDMAAAVEHQKDAVGTGYWPLFRFDPREAHDGKHAFQLDSHAPKKKFREFAMKEARFAMLAGANPAHSDELLDMAQRDIDARWKLYEQMAHLDRDVPDAEQEIPS